MKKLLLASVIVSAFILSSCAQSATHLDSDGFTYSDSPSVTTETLDENIPALEYKAKEIKQPNFVYSEKSKSLDNIANTNYINNGLLIMRNQYGNIGFYSLLKDKYILNPQFVENWFDYQVSTNQYCGFFLYIHNDDKFMVYDGFGNTLYYGANPISNVYTTMVNKDIYVTVTIYQTGQSNYFKYNDTGAIVAVTSIPTESQDPVEEEEPYTGPEINQDFQEDWIDLSKHGLKGYYLFDDTQGLYTIIKFDHATLEKKAICQFNVDQNTCKELGVVGRYFVYQQTLPLPDDSVSFSYSENGKKYSLETFFVDLTNGKVSTRDLMGIFTDLFPLINKDEEYQQYILTYKKINRNYALAETLTKIIDRDFVLHEDISGYNYDGFIKIEDIYYNNTTKIIYDSEFQPVTYIGMTNPTYKPNIRCFMGRIDGKYGLVDLNGKVALQYEYDNIYTDDYQNGYMIATKGEDVYRVQMYSLEETYLGKNVVRVAENLYYAKYNDSNNRYFKSNTNLQTISNKYTINRFSYLGQTIIYYLSYRDGSFFNYCLIEGQAGTVDKYINIPSSTQGEELTELVPDGSSREKAQVLDEGNNAVHNLNYGSWVTYKYTAVVTGYHSFYLSSSYRVNRIYKYVNDDITLLDYEITNLDDAYDSKTTTTYARKYTLALKAKDVIYIEINNNYATTQKYNIYVALEDGTDPNYPLTYNFNLSENVYTKSVEFMETRKIYFYFEAPKNAYYQLSSSTATNTQIRFSSGFKYDSSTGKYAAIEGTHCIVELYRSNSNTFASGTKFTISYSVISETPAGFSLKNALEASYGDNIALFNNVTLKQQVIFDTFYIKFAPGNRGSYLFNYSFSVNYTSNIQIIVYDKNGNERGMFNDNYCMEDTDYIVMSFNVGTQVSYFNSFVIYSNSGHSFDNPYNCTSYSVNTIDERRTAYVKYSVTSSENTAFAIMGTNTSNYRYAVYTYTRYVTPQQVEYYDYVTNGWHEFDSETPVLSLNENDYVMFSIYNTSSYEASFVLDKLVENNSPTIIELNGSVSIYSYSVNYLKYTNNTGSDVTVAVNFSPSDYASIFYSKTGFPSSSYYSYLAYTVIPYDNVYTLQHNESLYISIVNNSYSSFTLSIVNYYSVYYNIFTRISDNPNGARWTYNSDYSAFTFGSYNVESDVSMQIRMNQQGTLYFYVRSYGYDCSLDYITISKVDDSGNIIDIASYKDYYSTSYQYINLYVYSGETIIITWHNGSGAYGSSYYGAVRSIGFSY